MMPRNQGLNGWLVIDKPPGITSNAVVEHGPPRDRRQGRPCRHARSAGDRRAADRARRGDQDRRLCDERATRAIDSACAGAMRRDTDDGEGEVIGESPARPRRGDDRGDAAALYRHDRADAAGLFGAQDRGRRAYELARAGRAPPLSRATGRDRRACELPRHARPGPCRFRGRCRQGHLYPRPCPRSWRWRSARSAMSRQLRRSRSAASPKRKRFRWISGGCIGHSRCRFRASAADRDRAGRHPGAGLDGGRGRPAASRAARDAARIRRTGRVSIGSTTARSSVPGMAVPWSRWRGSKTAVFARCG